MDGQTPRKKSFLRRLARAVAVLAVVGVALVAAAPWLLSTPRAKDAIVGQVNRAIAPSRLGVKRLALSWFGRLRADGLTLRDGRGKTLIDARRAVLDRGLLALVRSPGRLGTVTLDGAAVDIERRADGSIDLVDAVVPPSPGSAPAAAGPKPAAPVHAGGGRRFDVTLRVVGGSLRLKTPELAGPLIAEAMDLEVHSPAAAGQKLSWRLRLAKPPGGTAAETLGVDGDYDLRAATDPDLSLTVKGVAWPLALAAPGAVAKGRLDGALKVARVKGSWSSTGDAKLNGLTADGPALAGDRPSFDSVAAVWDVAQAGGAWAVKNVGVVAPVGTLSARGSVAAGGGAVPEARVEGRVDLAALAKQLPHTLRLREGLTLERGAARVLVQVQTRGDAQTATVEADVSDLAARDPAHAFTLRDPATITAKGSRTEKGLVLDTLAVKTAFLNVQGAGDLAKGVRIAGTIDLANLEAQFKDLIDFGDVRFAGKGRMAGDFRKSGDLYVTRYAVELKGLKVAGLTHEPIARETLRLDAAASGPADAAGFPRGWSDLRVNSVAGPDRLVLAARRKGEADPVTVSGSADLPITFSQRDGRADLSLAGRWRPGAGGGLGRVEFDDLRATIRPTDPAVAAAGTVALAVKGSVDFDADDLTLSPLRLANGLPTVVAVGPEGLVYHGLRATPMPSKSAKGVLVGDVAAIERALFVWTGRTPGGYGGSLRAQLGMGPGKGRQNIGLNLAVPDLSRPSADGKGRAAEGPFTLSFGGGYDPGADRLVVDGLAVVTRYARVNASGLVGDPAGRRVADLQGTLAPAWDAVSALAAASVEPNLKLQGNPRAFRVAGPLSGDSLAAMLRGLDAEVGLDLTSADAFGLRLGPAPVVVHCRQGALTVDPINTTLNNGRVSLLPGLVVDDARGVAVTFARGSSIQGAEINDEVSRRLLTYVAPVLDRATQVNGKVSATFDHAEIPITGPDNVRTSLTGQLVFQDVVFAPGPFAQEILTLTGRPDSPGLHLHQPVRLEVANGRVIQKGLELPVRKDVTVALEGSVGFDETLDLRASVPITRRMLGGAAGLDDALGGQRVVVPIGGTVSRPRLNRNALQVALRELSKSVLKRELTGRANDLLNQVLPPPAEAAGAGAGGGAAGGRKPAPGNPPGDLKGLEGELLRRVLPRPRGAR